LRQAGFEIAVKHTNFTARPEHAHTSGGEPRKMVEWLLVARKPRRD
jgi:hypothetical protein